MQALLKDIETAKKKIDFQDNLKTILYVDAILTSAEKSILVTKLSIHLELEVVNLKINLKFI